MKLKPILIIIQMQTFNFIDLFSGAGGLSLGFEKAGFKCIGAIDNFEAAIKTHEYNFPDSVSICDDIRNISPSEFSKSIKEEVDVIVGGPPCPTFSTIGHAKIQSLGKSVYEDKRNTLFVEFLKYVEYFQPKYFVIENVPNFITKYNGEMFSSAIKLIENLEGDYNVKMPVEVLNAAQYGVPQTRRRMILVGYKGKYTFTYPKQTHRINNTKATQTSMFENDESLPLAVTVKEAISDLPNITDNWRIDEVEYSKSNNLSDFQINMRDHNSKSVRNNRCRMSNDRAKQVFQYMEQGSKYMDLDPEVRKILPFREDIFHDRLKRLKNNEPSWTVIAHIGMDGYMYIHPSENRTLSVREAARLQSFPDSFIFFGNMQQSYVQVGNAVPMILSNAIANKIFDSLTKS